MENEGKPAEATVDLGPEPEEERVPSYVELVVEKTCWNLFFPFYLIYRFVIYPLLYPVRVFLAFIKTK